MIELSEALTISEAAVASRIGRTKLYEAIADGRLVARKMGRKTLILRGDLHRFLNALPTMNSISAAVKDGARQAPRHRSRLSRAAPIEGGRR